ncbi:MAG: quinolinate synthase NadA, partial [Dehalococcoidia bacterium]|nr:quinolinate synthase NadA [Dehalococcoidia bacterium]
MTDIEQRIRTLKKELNAVILAHNYQRAEVQDIADFVGDSLELSRQATKVAAEVIVFCGVHFMAESAYILNPAKIVLLPEKNAGCPMADMIDIDDLREWRARYPAAAVVCYVNSSAAIKAESDVCCTSANAVKVVKSVPNSQILFVPDENLGRWVASQTKKEIIFYPGFCPTHLRLKADNLKAAKAKHPEAVVVAHPECRPEVTALADAVL